LHHIPFLVAYAIILQWCLNTIGDPLRLALAEKALKEAVNATLSVADEENDNATSAMTGVVDVTVGGDVSASSASNNPTFANGTISSGGSTSTSGNSTADAEAPKVIPLPNEVRMRLPTSDFGILLTTESL
jgi:hypothetical protein